MGLRTERRAVKVQPPDRQFFKVPESHCDAVTVARAAHQEDWTSVLRSLRPRNDHHCQQDQRNDSLHAANDIADVRPLFQLQPK